MRLSILGPAAVLAFSLISVTGCSGGGTGCGPTEEELDEQARAGTQRVTVTCGPGTRLEGNVCVRNGGTGTTGTTTTQPTTLGN
jgi:hypothetical protein